MFCKVVWNGIHILPDGYIRLCSIGANSNFQLDMQRARDRNGNVMHILTHSLEEIMNSDKHKQVRLLNAKDPNAWSPHCDCCERREIVTGHNRLHPNKSRRVYLLQMETDDIVSENNFKDKISETGEVDWMPNSLDVRFGNLCNQKCVMCSPTFSNQWYEDYFEYFDTNSFGQGSKITVTKDPITKKWIEPSELQWYENPVWWEKFEQMAPHLKHIYITGGEPMVTPGHDEMLQRLIDRDLAKNIWLEYDTNCTAINPKITDRWDKFKSVHLRGSMDSINEEYELIRYGGTWKKFVNNVKILKEKEKESRGKIKLLTLSSCLQLPNMFSITESQDFCDSVGVDFHIRFLEGPTFLSVNNLPIQAKMDLLNFYKNTSTAKQEIIVNFLENSINQKKYLVSNNIKKFYHYMDFLDTKRNTDWKKTLGKVHDFLSKY